MAGQSAASFCFYSQLLQTFEWRSGRRPDEKGTSNAEVAKGARIERCIKAHVPYHRCFYFVVRGEKLLQDTLPCSDSHIRGCRVSVNISKPPHPQNSHFALTEAVGCLAQVLISHEQIQRWPGSSEQIIGCSLGCCFEEATKVCVSQFARKKRSHVLDQKNIRPINTRCQHLDVPHQALNMCLLAPPPNVLEQAGSKLCAQHPFLCTSNSKVASSACFL